MTSIQLGTNAYKRDVAHAQQIVVKNRFFEQAPVNQVDQVSLLVRPRLKRWLEVGDGPIRGIYSQIGSFNDALFVVSYESLYRVGTDESVTFVGAGMYGASLRANVSMAATGNIGSTPEYLYIADGRVLWLYTDNAQSLGTLTATGAIVDGDTIRVGDVYYRWVDALADDDADGSSANPWEVLLGDATSDTLTNMFQAINASGAAGSTYTLALEANSAVKGNTATATMLTVMARTGGAAGDANVTSVISGAGIAWGAATLQGGGGVRISQVVTPDDVGIVSVAYINGFIICVAAQGYGINGRWYFIRPGETTIDALDYFTAERSPDGLYSVRVVGDQIWFMGANSVEVWAASGAEDPLFIRLQGRLLDRAVWEGTDVQSYDAVLLIDADGQVWDTERPGAPVSTPAITEMIRKAIQYQDSISI